MTQADTAPSQISQPALPNHLAQHPGGRQQGLVLLPFQRDNTDGQLDRKIDEDICAIYCGEADNDTIAQVVKCTPVIVLHQADEITLFRWHPTCPCCAGAL